MTYATIDIIDREGRTTGKAVLAIRKGEACSYVLPVVVGELGAYPHTHEVRKCIEEFESKMEAAKEVVEFWDRGMEGT